MTYVANKPVLIVEGQGDVGAMPHLIRKMAHHLGHYAIQPLPNAIRKASVGAFKTTENLSRFVRLAALRDQSDSIIIAIDCDDGCAKECVIELTERLSPIAIELHRKIGVCLFVKEFEALFLHCLEEIAASNPSFQIQLPCPVPVDRIETVRAAKGLLNQTMQNGVYKETRDQERFVHALDIEKLISQSRSARHLAGCLNFLVSRTPALVYPAPT